MTPDEIDQRSRTISHHASALLDALEGAPTLVQMGILRNISQEIYRHIHNHIVRKYKGECTPDKILHSHDMLTDLCSLQQIGTIATMSGCVQFMPDAMVAHNIQYCLTVMGILKDIPVAENAFGTRQQEIAAKLYETAEEVVFSPVTPIILDPAISAQLIHVEKRCDEESEEDFHIRVVRRLALLRVRAGLQDFPVEALELMLEIQLTPEYKEKMQRVTQAEIRRLLNEYPQMTERLQTERENRVAVYKRLLAFHKRYVKQDDSDDEYDDGYTDED